MFRTHRLAAVAVLCALAPAADAGAATLNVNATTITYTAGAGKANNINLTAAAGFVQASENSAAPGDPITVTGTLAGSCSGSGTNYVQCSSGSINPATTVLNAGNENIDDIVGGSVPQGTFSVYGGPGDDTIQASGNVYGEDGADVLIANTLPSQLNGGNGNDRLMGGDAVDIFSGGADTDTVDYSNQNAK